MLESDLAQQVQAQQGEAYDPDGQIDFAVQQVPVVGLVGHAQEFQAQGHFYEAQHHLDAVEPAAALGELLQRRREKGQQGKGQGEGNGEGQHSDHGGPEFALRALDEHGSHDGAGAAKAYQHQRKGQEKHAQKAVLTTFGIGLGGPAGRQGNFKRAEERGREHHEDDKEQDVREPVGGQPVEDIGRYRFAAQEPGKADDDADGHRIQQHDENPVHKGLEAAAGLLLEEERHRHGHHREHAGSQEHQEAPEDSLQNQTPQAAAFFIPGRTGNFHRHRERPFFRHLAEITATGTPGNTSLHGGRAIDLQILPQYIGAGHHFFPFVITGRKLLRGGAGQENQVCGIYFQQGSGIGIGHRMDIILLVHLSGYYQLVAVPLCRMDRRLPHHAGAQLQ